LFTKKISHGSKNAKTIVGLKICPSFGENFFIKFWKKFLIQKIVKSFLKSVVFFLIVIYSCFDAYFDNRGFERPEGLFYLNLKNIAEVCLNLNLNENSLNVEFSCA